jgi:hypothetical protein
MALHAQIYLPIALVVGRLYAAAMVIFLTNPAFLPFLKTTIMQIRGKYVRKNINTLKNKRI